MQTTGNLRRTLVKRKNDLLEEWEVHTPVRARLHMPRVAREIGIFTVFDNEPSVFF